MADTLLSAAKFDSLLNLFSQVQHLAGDVAELGVFRGGSLIALANRAPHKAVYGFDTFEGLPVEHWTPTEVHRPQEFSNTSYNDLLAKVPGNCQLVKGLFPDSAIGYEDANFCFAHVDFDFEEGTRQAINWLLPRMVSGGMIVFDDYKWPNCPGVEKAIVEAGLPVQQSVMFQCFYIKP